MGSNGTVAEGRPLTLTRRGRVVAFILAATLLGVIALIVPGVLTSATADAPAAPQRVEVVTISSGQTLWQVASTMTEAGDDVRVALGLLMELNGLTSADVQAGQQVLVPAI